jgi:hypothetical protein
MPGTVHVDIRATFQTILLMSIAEKLKFGTDVPEVSASGEAKYTAELAVTYRAENGMKPVSEVISATLTGGDRNAIMSIPPGSLVEVTALRCGVSAPEQRPDGRGVRGGRLYWMLGSIRPVGQVQKAA